MSIDAVEGQSEGGEEQVSTESGASAELEQLVGDKMNAIFAKNEDQNQADESEQTGRVTPENPDGLAEGQDPVADEQAPAVATDEVEVPLSVDELEEAKQKAVAEGDYETAIELRDRIKEAQAEAAQKPAAADDKAGDKEAVLTADERAIMKGMENWTDKDLDILSKNPEFARMTYRRVQDKYNDMSLRYAQESVRQSPGIAQPGANPATVAQTATLESLYKDLDKFGEVAGSEMVDRFIKPLKAEVLEPLKDVVAFVNESRQRAIADEGNAAMAKIAVGDFADVYGDKPETLTDVQKNNRNLLYDAADRITAGARAHKIPMRVTEALNRAHLMLTAHQQIKKSNETARRGIVAQVRRRSSQITSRPSQRVGRVAVRSNQNAENVVEKFWEGQAEA